jgi:predicted Rdx family selenoprotein
VAELLKRELSITEVGLIAGGRGEFTVWVDETIVAKKSWLGFPDEQQVLSAVRDALNA